MTSGASTPASSSGDPRRDAQHAARPTVPRLDLADVAAELIAIAGYVTADDGPLQPTPEGDVLSPWHEPLLAKAHERLEIIDAHLRGRVTFLVAGKDHGYLPLDDELALARAALDNCRVSYVVVEALLERRLPRVWQFDLMGETTLRLLAAMATE